MKSRTLSATSLILLTPLIVLAFKAQADQVRGTELKSKFDGRLPHHRRRLGEDMEQAR